MRMTANGYQKSCEWCFFFFNGLLSKLTYLFFLIYLLLITTKLMNFSFLISSDKFHGWLSFLYNYSETLTTSNINEISLN